MPSSLRCPRRPASSPARSPPSSPSHAVPASSPRRPFHLPQPRLPRAARRATAENSPLPPRTPHCRRELSTPVPNARGEEVLAKKYRIRLRSKC